MKPFILSLCGVAAIIVACGGDSDDPDEDSGTNPLTQTVFSFSWGITDGTDALDCDDVDAQVVSIKVIPVNGFAGRSDSFGCTAGLGQTVSTQVFDPGLYHLEFSITSPQGDLLSAENAISMRNVELPETGPKDLGAIDFIVTPAGSLTFTLAAAASDGNCTDPDASDGAGIVALELRLVDDEGECPTGTFAIGAGASLPAASHDNDCTETSRFAGCIDADQVVTVATRSGAHTLQVTGYRAGDLACYSGQQAVAVPGNDLTNELDNPLGLLVDEENPACVPPVDAGPPEPDASADLPDAGAGLPDAGADLPDAAP